MRRFLNSPFTIWAVLAVPGMAMVIPVLFNVTSLAAVIHPSGEWSVRMLVLAMMITPLSQLFPRRKWVLWLINRRRYIGLACFAYAVLHLSSHIAVKGSAALFSGTIELAVLSGWIAFLFLIPIAVTSNRTSVQKLGRHWKRLQRLVYVIAGLVLLHWLVVGKEPVAPIIHFLPLAVVQILRMRKSNKKRAPRSRTHCRLATPCR